MRKKSYFPKVKGVHIIVHPNFFDNVFEPKRRETERRLKKTISQMEFTGILANSNFNFNIDLKQPNMRFAPKRRRKFRL